MSYFIFESFIINLELSFATSYILQVKWRNLTRELFRVIRSYYWEYKTDVILVKSSINQIEQHYDGLL